MTVVFFINISKFFCFDKFAFFIMLWGSNPLPRINNLSSVLSRFMLFNIIPVTYNKTNVSMAIFRKKECRLSDKWYNIKIIPNLGCGPPNTIGNGTIDGGDLLSFAVGTTLTYSCSSGFALMGESNTTCLSSLLLSLDNTLPMCRAGEILAFELVWTPLD